MSKHDFARRLKCMVYDECEVVKAESKIAQKFAKYCEQVASLKTIVAKQKQDLSRYRAEVEMLKKDNNKLQRFVQREEDRRHDLLKRVEQLQFEYDEKLQQQIEQRWTELLKMDCVRNLKLATNTYINLNALPHRIQGVTVCEKQSSSDWKPFCIDPSKHTRKEVEEMIWHDSEVDIFQRENIKTNID